MDAPQLFNGLISEMRKSIVGQDRLIERLLISLLADGHLLLEGVPGLAKTKVLQVLSECIEARMQRVQFTPDLLPSDLLGTEVYRPNTGEFVIRQGPIFTNVLLADEINRAPAKVQSALLQAMQERQVSIGEHTFALPSPFLVLATQNPIEQEGTYPLPEAQLDRFLMKVIVKYPSFQEEVQIVELVTSKAKDEKIRAVLSLNQLGDLRRLCQELYVDPKVFRYVVALVQASRESKKLGLEGMIEWGASPRASIALIAAARSLAFIRGKKFVTPDEVKELAPDVLRHRILPSFEGEARGITPDEIVSVLLRSVTVP